MNFKNRNFVPSFDVLIRMHKVWHFAVQTCIWPWLLLTSLLLLQKKSVCVQMSIVQGCRQDDWIYVLKFLISTLRGAIILNIVLKRFGFVFVICNLSVGKNTKISYANKSYRRASNVTKLCSMQTLASQPRSSVWLLQPWGHWQWQQLAPTADSWIFVDSRTQTRAECKHPVDASMQF